MKNFVHLHVHTEYSLLDGATRIDKLFKQCDRLGMPAIAITDHGNMFGALDFCKAAVRYTDPDADFYEFIHDPSRKFKVKPIIGCEVYTTEDMSLKVSDKGHMPKNNHLVLLAKNKIGYHNLIKMVSLGYTEGLYYKPRIDFELLEQHAEGLIALSACLAGVIPQCILANDLAGAERHARKFKALFGDDFYIELQDHNIKDQKLIIPHLTDIARRNQIKMVATNDVHYLEKKDAITQKVLQCISFRRTLSEDEAFQENISEEGIEDGSYFPTNEFYLKSAEEMQKLFPGLDEALSNTLEVAEKCSCDFFDREHLFPKYQPKNGDTPIQFLRELTENGLKKKYDPSAREPWDRAKYELDLIEKQGFVEYFLIVWDFIHYAESKDIPVGPGRGSGVGSIVAYAIGITKVDPLKYGLIFERFINAERISSPDFDIDFCVEGRDQVIDYVIEKYSASNVSQIVTFGTLAAKAAVKDVGRVLNQPYSEVEKLTKLIPFMMGKNHLGDLIGADGKTGAIIPELRDIYENDAVAKRILDMAMQIEGMPRQTGMHAAGVIICKDPISEHIPLAKSGDGIVTTQFNMIECEELGLLKMDFLGLRTLTDIHKAQKLVKQTKGIDIDFYQMEYNDPEVFRLISEGDTHAIFQLESEGMKKFMRDLKPGTLEDIIAGISLYRPGPMDKIGEYVHNKKHPDKIKYDHPIMQPILEVTYGVMVYQEQVMEAVRKLAGYTLGRADIVRRIMSKKKKAAMEAERETFLYGTKDGMIKGCIANGVSEKVANKIYDDMISFASYAFNKSHAAAYAYLAYQTAYLKRYHTVEFIAAVLNNRINSIEEIRNYLSYLKEKNIQVLPPNINRSYSDFTVEDGAIRIGMSAIKNVGSSVVADIVKERERGGAFKDFIQFVERMDRTVLNRKMLESLIYAGTFDCFQLNRSQLIAVYESVMDRVNKDREAKTKGQFSFFDMTEVFADTFEYPALAEYPLAEKLRREKEVAGVYLSGHPLDEYAEHLQKYAQNTSMFKLLEEPEKEALNNRSVTLGGMLIEADRRITKNGRELGAGKLEDLHGVIEVMISPFKMAQLRQAFQKDKLVTVTGKLSYKEESFLLWADTIEEWSGVRSDLQSRKMCLYMSFRDIRTDTLDLINEIIHQYPGKDAVYIKNMDDNVLYPLKSKVDAAEALQSELYGLEDVRNIKVV